MFSIDIAMLKSMNKNLAMPDRPSNASRYYLAGVNFEACDGYVAVLVTDGSVALIHKLPVEGMVKGKFEPFTLPAAQIDAIKPAKGVKEVKLVISDGEKYRREIAVIYGNVNAICKELDGSFPDVRRIMPDNTYIAGAGLINLAIAMKFQNFVKDAKLEVTVQIVPREGDKPVLVRFGDRDDMYGAMMGGIGKFEMNTFREEI